MFWFPFVLVLQYEEQWLVLHFLGRFLQKKVGKLSFFLLARTHEQHKRWASSFRFWILQPYGHFSFLSFCTCFISITNGLFNFSNSLSLALSFDVIWIQNISYQSNPINFTALQCNPIREMQLNETPESNSYSSCWMEWSPLIDVQSNIGHGRIMNIDMC